MIAWAGVSLMGSLAISADQPEAMHQAEAVASVISAYL